MTTYTYTRNGQTRVVAVFGQMAIAALERMTAEGWTLVAQQTESLRAACRGRRRKGGAR